MESEKLPETEDNTLSKAPFPTCSDAQVLMSFKAEIGTLIEALKDLDQQADGMRDLSPSKARDVMLFAAGGLQKRITDVRHALLRRDELTMGRETQLIDLRRAIDRLENILRSRLSDDWMFRRGLNQVMEAGLDEWIANWERQHALTETDRILEQIENAYPEPINATKIAEVIGSTPGKVRARLSRFCKKYPNHPLFESDVSGKTDGYLWIRK